MSLWDLGNRERLVAPASWELGAGSCLCRSQIRQARATAQRSRPLRLRRQGPRPPHAHRSRTAPPDARARRARRAAAHAIIDAVSPALKNTATSTTQPLPKPTPACARKTRSSASAASARICSRRASRCRPHHRDPRSPLRRHQRGSSRPPISRAENAFQNQRVRRTPRASCAAWSPLDSRPA